MKLEEPVFDHLLEPELLEKVQRGDTQNPNKAF
jgi:hypothetical protein